MPKTIKIAVVQMNAEPLSTQERLNRAENFVKQCVQNGAQLIVLPEVFNTGYEYSDRNYSQAEGMDDSTAIWMKKSAFEHQVYIAGTFLRRDQNHIYNTLLMVAPDGRQWHYDKNYPWIWERAYFRKGREIAIADTEFGRIGFLICWDVAHANLWQQYSGKVDLMIICSCPPKVFDLDLVFPDGKRISGDETGLFIQYLKRRSDQTFGVHLRKQAAYLGVSVAQATSTGTFCSLFPNPRLTLALLSVLYPPLWKYISQFDRVRMETNYFNESYIADPSGKVLQSVQLNVEGFAVHAVTLPDSTPPSKGKQPAFGLPAFAYFFDLVVNWLLAFEYRKKTKG